MITKAMNPSLVLYEKSLRKTVSNPAPEVSTTELLISAAISLIATPFLLSLLFMIPFIGQGLFLFAAVLTITYFIVRSSVKLVAVCIFSYLLFVIPLFLSIQGIKYKLEVVLFFLMAGCIPVGITYITLVAARIWYFLDLKYNSKKNRP